MHFSKRMAQVVVVGALIAAMILAVRHGIEKGADGWATAAFVIALGCIALGEFLSWHNAACSWHERRLGGVALWGTLGVMLTGGVMYTNFSSAASNNDGVAGVHKATFTTQTDVGAAIKETERAVARLEESVRMMPKRTPEGARAHMDNAKAHRFWGVTEQCTKTLGPQTRTFCDAYRAAESDMSLGASILLDKEALKQANEKLAQLRSARASAPKQAMGEDQAGLRFIANKAGVSLDDARLFDSAVVAWMIQVMLVFGGIALAAELYRDKPRLPWVDTGKWARRYRMARNGGVDPLAPTPAPPPASGWSREDSGWSLDDKPATVDRLHVVRQSFADPRLAQATAAALERFAGRQLPHSAAA